MRLEDGEMLVVVEQKHIGFERGDIQGVSLWVSPQYDKGRGVLLTPAQAREVGRALVAHADAAEREATPFAIRERDEARAEVERLKQEFAAAKQRADEWECLAVRWMLRAEDAEEQMEHDNNACANVLHWARNLAAGKPMPSRAVAAVLKELAKARAQCEELRPAAQKWHDAVGRNAKRLAELEAANPGRVASPIDAVVDDVLFGEPS